MTGHVAAGFPLCAERTKPLEVLNAFAYTCGFSLCSAKIGARVTSVDLSRRYLEWGKRNFSLNGVSPDEHDFIIGDVFDWSQRLARKGRKFDVVVLDPPTFSRSKQGGAFRAAKDYGRLVKSCLPLLSKGGVLFASTNAAGLTPPAFLKAVESALESSGRRLLRQQYFPQPPDFPICRAEPGYLKTIWLAVE